MAWKDQACSFRPIHLLQRNDVGVELSCIPGESLQVSSRALKPVSDITGETPLGAAYMRFAWSAALFQGFESRRCDEPLEIPRGELQ